MKNKKTGFYSNRKVMSYDRNDFTWCFIISERGTAKSYQQQKMLKEKENGKDNF